MNPIANQCRFEEWADWMKSIRLAGINTQDETNQFQYLNSGNGAQFAAGQPEQMVDAALKCPACGRPINSGSAGTAVKGEAAGQPALYQKCAKFLVSLCKWISGNRSVRVSSERAKSKEVGA